MLQPSLHLSGATLNLPYHALIPDHHTIAPALTVEHPQRLQPTDHTCLASQLPHTKVLIRPPMVLAQAFPVHCTQVLRTHHILPIEMTGEALPRHQTRNLSFLKLPKSLNAGSMVVTVANFLHSAIFLGTSGRSLERHRNRSAIVVERSSLEKRHATAIWPMTNASHAPPEVGYGWGRLGLLN